MKLASHNTFTYLPVKQWYLKPFAFMGRCQSKDVVEQFDAGARLFDLRVSFSKGHVQISHGLLDYKGDVFEILGLLNVLSSSPLYVRVILEKINNGFDYDRFKAFCQKIEREYQNIFFVSGRDKKRWEIIYPFKTPEPTLDDKYSSQTWKIWDDWFPLLYAKIMNKRNLKKGTDKEYLMIDFVK